MILGLPVEEAAVLADRVAEGDVALDGRSGQRRPRAGEGEREVRWFYVMERDQDRERAGVLCRGWEQGGDEDVDASIVRDRQIGIYSLRVLTPHRCSTFNTGLSFVLKAVLALDRLAMAFW